MIRFMIVIVILFSMFLISANESHAGTFAFPDACCFSNGSCQDLAHQSCLESGGEVIEDQDCEDVSCPAPEPTGPTVIIPTMGQWGIIFTSLVLAVTAVFMLRRRTEL